MISVLLVSRTPTSRQRLHLDVVGASADEVVEGARKVLHQLV